MLGDHCSMVSISDTIRNSNFGLGPNNRTKANPTFNMKPNRIPNPVRIFVKMKAGGTIAGGIIAEVWRRRTKSVNKKVSLKVVDRHGSQQYFHSWHFLFNPATDPIPPKYNDSDISPGDELQSAISKSLKSVPDVHPNMSRDASLLWQYKNATKSTVSIERLIYNNQNITVSQLSFPCDWKQIIPTTEPILFVINPLSAE